MSISKDSYSDSQFAEMVDELTKLRRWRKKIYPEWMSEQAIEHHQKGLLTLEERRVCEKKTSTGLLKWVNELTDEKNSLKKKVEKDKKKIDSLKGEIEYLHHLHIENNELIDSLRNEIDILKEQNMVNGTNCVRLIEEWQGRSLRLNWLLKEMERVGAIKEDHDWVIDLRNSIEFPIEPDQGGVSVYEEIPFNVMANNIPNHMDSHMEEVDEYVENERIEEWSDEARSFVELEQNLACLTIQNTWRKFKKRKVLSQDWIDNEKDNIFGNMFDEDERAYTLEYLEFYSQTILQHMYHDFSPVL